MPVLRSVMKHAEEVRTLGPCRSRIALARRYVPGGAYVVVICERRARHRQGPIEEWPQAKAPYPAGTANRTVGGGASLIDGPVKRRDGGVQCQAIRE